MKNCSTLNIWSGIFVLKTNFFHIAITSDRNIDWSRVLLTDIQHTILKAEERTDEGKSELKIDNEIQFNSILSEIERCACLQQTTAQKWNGAINESADKNVSQLSKQNIFHVEPGFFGVSFCHCGSIVIGGYWIVNILSWIIQAIFPLHSLFWSKSKEIFSIHRAQLHMLVTSLSVSLLLSHTLPPHLLLHALSFGCSAATGYLFSPHFMPVFSQYGRSRVWNVPKEFVVQECIMCKTMTNSNRSAVDREKKRLCTEPSIQSMKFIKKEIHFRATIFFFFLSRYIFHGIFFLSIRSMLHSFWILSLFSPSLSAFGEFSWSIFRLCAFKWKI